MKKTVKKMVPVNSDGTGNGFTASGSNKTTAPKTLLVDDKGQPLAIGGGGGTGGAVDSVNGKTGVVLLDYTDVGAASDAQAAIDRERIDLLFEEPHVVDVFDTNAEMQNSLSWDDGDICICVNDESNNGYTTYYQFVEGDPPTWEPVANKITTAALTATTLLGNQANNTAIGTAVSNIANMNYITTAADIGKVLMVNGIINVQKDSGGGTSSITINLRKNSVATPTGGRQFSMTNDGLIHTQEVSFSGLITAVGDIFSIQIQASSATMTWNNTPGYAPSVMTIIK